MKVQFHNDNFNKKLTDKPSASAACDGDITGALALLGTDLDTPFDVLA